MTTKGLLSPKFKQSPIKDKLAQDKPTAYLSDAFWSEATKANEFDYESEALDVFQTNVHSKTTVKSNVEHWLALGGKPNEYVRSMRPSDSAFAPVDTAFQNAAFKGEPSDTTSTVSGISDLRARIREKADQLKKNLQNLPKKWIICIQINILMQFFYNL